jgi:hypothetical protein
MDLPKQRFRAHTAECGSKCLKSTVALTRGDVLCAFTGTYQTQPTRHSIQVNDVDHMLVDPVELQYINHSCDPNVAFDVERREVRALRPIQPGDEFFYFYPSTEWDMAEPFICNCGTVRCLKLIRGARHLPQDVLKQYEFQDHIQQRLVPARRTRKRTG